MGKWNKVTLGSICSFKYGQMPKKSELVDTGYPVFSGYRIVGYSKIYHYKEPEIIVVARGEGGTGDIKMSPPNCFLTNLSIVVLIESEEVDKSFLFYRLASTKLWSLRTGSAQAQITIDRLKDYEIELPTLFIQRHIANVATSFDVLIENNKSRIKILEEIARLLYREWFVYFRYPGHGSVPLVNSSLGSIPKGWSVKKMKDIADVGWGDTNVTKSSYVNEGFDAYSATGRDGFRDTYDYDKSGIVLSAIGANCGKTWLAMGKWSCIKNTIRIFGTDEVPTEFLYYLTGNLEFWSRRGSAQPFISQTDIRNKELIVPDKNTLTKFTLIVSNILKQAHLLNKKNEYLREMRDLLLPRLISGQITLDEKAPVA